MSTAATPAISRCLLALPLALTFSLSAGAQLRPETAAPQPAPEKKPAPAKSARIVVETLPNAHVYLDDAFKGEASPEGRLVIEDAKPGAHKVRVSQDGKQTFEADVTVAAGKETSVKAILAGASARITIRSSPGAGVYLDDSLRGTTDSSGQFVFPEVSAGPHNLRISAPGKRAYQQQVNVVAGQPSQIDAPLLAAEGSTAGASPGSSPGASPGTSPVAPRGSIGLRLAAPDPAALKNLGVVHGVLISQVEPGTPADAAGLKPGDVITWVNGKPVSAGNDVVGPVFATPIGGSVQITYVRDKRDHEVSVGVVDYMKLYSDSHFGLQVENIPMDLAQKLGQTNGVYVLSAEPGSFSVSVGVVAGDVVQEVNRQAIQDIYDWRRAVAQLHAGDQIVFKVRRRGSGGAEASTLTFSGQVP
ncbi:MAG TPA: PDZ domain-containing protein [Candidatus Acidoferrales bacterium]|nr:PDZ domain-containing protein [Candidatus Acidoferrales bacterium]